MSFVHVGKLAPTQPKSTLSEQKCHFELMLNIVILLPKLLDQSVVLYEAKTYSIFISCICRYVSTTCHSAQVGILRRRKSEQNKMKTDFEIDMLLERCIEHLNNVCHTFPYIVWEFWNWSFHSFNLHKSA